MKFYSLKVKDIRQETPDCVSIAFNVPDSLMSEFSFNQGQYLTLRTFIAGDEVRRSYSICSSPFEHEWRVAVKQIPDGLFSTYANKVLKKGDWVDVAPPLGNFNTPLSIAADEGGSSKNYIFFAAGSGITPIISNIKAILAAEPQSHCTLIYGNRRISSIIFKEEIEALKNKHLDRFQVFNVLSRERTESDLMYGRLDTDKIRQFVEKIPSLLPHNLRQKESGYYFACGPIEMIEAVKEVLAAHGVDEKRIHFELFNAPKGSQKTVILTSAVASHAIVKLDGLTFDVPVDKGQNILDAAQAIGADVPYACKGGVCCTCRAKLIEGDVDMQANYALTKEEVAQGFILTCQAIPKTPKVAVDFDTKWGIS